MIQWIAMAVAVDANCRASRARDAANYAEHQTRKSGVDPMVTVNDFDFELVPNKSARNLLQKLAVPYERVLCKSPARKFVVKRSDIEHLREYRDAGGNSYVGISISPYANLWLNSETRLLIARIPGTLEEVSAILNGETA